MKHLKRSRSKRKRSKTYKRIYKKSYRLRTYKKTYKRSLKGGWGIVMGSANPYAFPVVSQKKAVIVGGWGQVAPV